MTDKPTRQNRGLASSQTAREINRDIVLRTIHLRQPVSRADLARLTGLQASTVSLIIGQLIEEGWVSPGTLGRLPRGRVLAPDRAPGRRLGTQGLARAQE